VSGPALFRRRGSPALDQALGRWGDLVPRLDGPRPAHIDLARPLSAALANRRALLEITLTAENCCGHGEAAPAWWIGEATIEESRAALEAWRRRVGSRSLRDLCSNEAGLLPTEASAHAAVATAALDLLARLENLPVAKLLGNHDPGPAIALSRLLADGDTSATRASAGEALDGGWHRLKLKVGARTAQEDRRRIGAVLERLGPEGRLRLDANRAWDFATAERVLEGMGDPRIEFIEEPLAAPVPERLSALAAASGLAIAIDESLTAARDLTAWLGVEGIDAFVLKPQRLGGPLRAADLADSIRQGGARAVLTDSIEGATGSAAVVHLAAGLGVQDAVGLGGRALAHPASPSEVARALGPGLDVAWEVEEPR
jgi:o-succinylbenzoate synthase